MKTILFGLVQALGGWLALAALLSWTLQTRYELRAVDTIGIALFTGALAWPAFGLFVSAIHCGREILAIRRGVKGVPPADNAQVVLVGAIEASGPLLRAPMDGSPCVAYAYQMQIDSGTGKRRHIATLARGVALTPSRIVTRSGAYRLLVVPDLEAAQPVASRDTQVARFLAYAKDTAFTEQTGAAKELLQRWSDGDGAYRSDVRFVELQGADTRCWVPTQQHVPPGALVCVFGRHDAMQGGIVPSVTRPARLICGNAQEVIASLRSKIVTRTLIGSGLGAAVALLLVSFVRG